MSIVASRIEGTLAGLYGATVRVYPEAAGQTFVKGDFVYLSSYKVTELADGGNVVLGIAMEDASGTENTSISVAVFDVQTRIILCKTDTKVADATAVTDVTTQMYLAKSSAGVWVADVHDYGNVALWVEALYPHDVVGTSGGRLICGIIPGALQVDNSAIASSVTGLTSTLAEVNIATDLSANKSDGTALTTRHRATIAEVNAGHSLLTAISGYKYRIIDAKLIAIGGALAATANATGVAVKGTQSASEVDLFAADLAAMTQNTLVIPGVSANTDILAAGASFVECDANTAITVEAVGGTDLITATHIDVILTYTLIAA